jgi:hypothetical protein
LRKKQPRPFDLCSHIFLQSSFSFIQVRLWGFPNVSLMASLGLEAAAWQLSLESALPLSSIFV